jgi:hypothetical protein
MGSSVYIDGFFEVCPHGQATARRANVGPFVFVPGPRGDQALIDTSFSWCSCLSAMARAFCRWVASQSATSVDRANFPRLRSIENTVTGTVFRATAWRKAPLVGYPSAAVNALPHIIGPCTANSSCSKARASSGSAVVEPVFMASCEVIAKW